MSEATADIRATQLNIAGETAGTIRGRSQEILEELVEGTDVVSPETSVTVLLSAIFERLDRLEDNAGYGPLEEAFLAAQDTGEVAQWNSFFDDESPTSGVQDTEEVARWSSATGEPLNYSARAQDTETQAALLLADDGGDDAEGFFDGDGFGRENVWVEFYELDGDVQDFLINEAVDGVVGALYDVGGDEYTAEDAVKQATEFTAELAEDLLAELEDEVRHQEYLAALDADV